MHYVDHHSRMVDAVKRKETDCCPLRAMAEHRNLAEAERQLVRNRYFGQVGECNMCGDVGFADQLLSCTGCKSHVQHSYCSISKEGADCGAWLCDWCRLSKQCPPKKDFKGCKPHPIIVKPRSIALDFLVQVALSPTELGDLDVTEDFNTLNMDCGSYSSSSTELYKPTPRVNGVREREKSSSCENKIVTSDDEGSLGSRKDCAKKKPQLQRSSSKLPKLAASPENRSPGSSIPSHRLEARKLKRLSSLKNSARPRTSPPVDGVSKGFTPRFKSLLDISC